MTNSQAPQPAHTPGPWVAIFPESRYFHEGSDITSFDVLTEKTRAQFRAEGREHYARRDEDVANVEIVSCQFWRDKTDEEAKANARLIAAAPELLVACINARDMLATDRQAFVDCQQLRDSRTDDPIAHGLVAVEDGVWLDADDAEALRDYDRAIELIDKATAKATGAQA